MYSYEFPRPSVTATVVLYDREEHGFLIARRRDDVEAYPGCWSFPGGFLNAKTDEFEGETIEETAVREIHEETSIYIHEDELELVSICSRPDVDPRAHVVNICYLVKLNNADFKLMRAGDDIAELGWLPVKNIRDLTRPDLAFNHVKIANDALNHLRLGF